MSVEQPRQCIIHGIGVPALSQALGTQLVEGGYTDAVDDALARLLHAHTPLLLW